MRASSILQDGAIQDGSQNKTDQGGSGGYSPRHHVCSGGHSPRRHVCLQLNIN